MKICLTGGGSAGHVMPNIAISESLKKENYELIYIGSNNEMEKELIEAHSIPFFSITTGKLKRYHAMSNFKMPFNVIQGINESRKILKKESIDLVFSKGGFVSVPVVLAAHMLKIPIISHEADMTPGLANKICIPYSNKVCVSFEHTLSLIPKEKGVYTGLPIRKEILKGDINKGLSFCSFEPKEINNKFKLLIIGGSQGSLFINNLIRENIDSLCKYFDIIHSCGKGHLDIRIKNPSYKQVEFLSEELKDIYAMSDIIISRAGANMIYEIMALGKYNLLIPLSKSVSRGDQILNAKACEKANLSKVVYEEDIMQNKNVFFNAIKELYDNRNIYKKALSEWKKFDATEKIVEQINTLMKK
ncbi:MAG: undecaprenyldiphospho-muramoylpentapeptide beta-N-acetylglucosaminyltransferase [Eubacteriales bacterium]|nr:undecaprenyldiphospho-muramoylpentapeptide beta-N-acetylglucosaminyltransferase [Eubacteriales bacterium]